MIREFSSGLVLPALALGVLGWLVPRLLARVWPEGVGPLLVLGFVATILLFGLATAFFVLLYTWQGAPLRELVQPGRLVGFARLGLLSTLLWAPVLVLSVAGLPRHWKEKTW